VVSKKRFYADYGERSKVREKKKGLTVVVGLGSLQNGKGKRKMKTIA